MHERPAQPPRPLHGEAGAKGAQQGHSQAVGEAGGEVRFMGHHRNAPQPAGQHHRKADEAALGKDGVWTDAAQQPMALPNAAQHGEGVGEVAPGKVAPQLAGGDAVVAQFLPGEMALIGAVRAANVEDLRALPAHGPHDRQGRQHMAGAAAAGEDDCFDGRHWRWRRPRNPAPASAREWSSAAAPSRPPDRDAPSPQ